MRATCLVSLALLAAASAVPASVQRWDSYGDSNSCAQTCKDRPNKFSYKTGTTYFYEYAVDTETSMAGASEDSAKLSIQALAEIQVIDRCEFALLMKDVRVSHSDGYSSQLKPADQEDEVRRVLEGSNLRFSFDDGVITSICPEKAETTWALNFKRGLLSAFQNTMENFDKNQKMLEVSVTGDCEAEFNVSKSWSWNKETRVIKTKNLLACSKRDGYKSMFQITPYSINSEVQSLAILKGTHTCEYVIDTSRVLKSTSCDETHVYMPFSNNESGGKTKVQQKLTLKGQKDGVDAIKGPVKDRLSLLFDHSNTLDQLQNGPETLEQKLKEICDQTQEDLRPETPRLYSELIHIVKTLSKSDIERAYKMVKDKIICPKNDRTLKFLMDALPMASAEGPIGLMTTLINTRQVDGLLADSWLLTLALVQEPTDSMVEESLKLLQGPLSSRALLPVSSLVHRYCKKAENCESDYFVGQILNVLKNKIPDDCYADPKNLKDLLVALKAVGNIGQGSLTSTLDKCLSSDSASLEVKVAAANAFRRMPCDTSDGQVDSSLWTSLKDSSQDVELRITSYLALMRCPTDDTLEQISQLLEKEEEDQQVGGFIYSHLKNLKETSDPHKQEIAKAILMRSFKEFPINYLKSSHNHEASVLINRLNLGFTADSNLIMNPMTPIPRSAMLNLTVEMFGSSVNLLEIGGRVEGLEILVEKLIGPNGYFPTKKGENKLSDVRGSYYARVFGNELLFGQVTGAEGKLPNFLDMLIAMANKQDVSYTHSGVLMDVALIVPTVAGLPLEVTVNGSVNLDLKAQGKADLRRVAYSPRSMEIDGEFRPSAALEVTGTMAVDALVTRMGLRMRNTMHSSTWLKGRIEINRGILNVEILPPGDKMEIFNAKSQFFIIHNNMEKEQNMIRENYQEYKSCSGDKLATILGVELCGELKFPNASSRSNAPFFPLTGPSSINIMTYRRDTHTHYKLLAKRIESKQRSVAQFMIDTPNSVVNRMISADVTILYTPDKQIDVVVVSPWKKFNMNSALVMNKDIASFVGSIVVDDRDKYGLTTEVKISKNGNGYTYSPLIELTMSGRTDALVSGQIIDDIPNKFDANLEFKAVGKLPYTVRGGFVNTDKEKRISASMASQGKDIYVFDVGTNIETSGKDVRSIKVQPSLILKSRDQTLLSITGSNDYKADKSAIGDVTVEVYRIKPASLTWKLGQASKPKQTYNIDIKMKSSVLTGTIGGNIGLQKNGFSSKLGLSYNIPRFGLDDVTWNMKFNDKSKATFMRYQLTSNVEMKKYKDYNTGILVNFDHKKKQTDVNVELKYGANLKDKKKVIRLKSSLNNEIKSWNVADVNFIIRAQAPEKNVDLNLNFAHAHSTSSAKLNCSASIKLQPFLKNEISAGISLENKSNKLAQYTGQAKLDLLGSKYLANTGFTQITAKHYQHILDVQSPGGKNTINTIYRIPSANGHEVTTDIILSGYKPVQVKGEAVLDISNFQVSGSTVYDKDVYNISAQSKTTVAVKKYNFDLVYPGRHVDAEAELKNTKDKVSANVMLDWDAAKASKSKISLDGSYKNTGSWDSGVMSGTINVKTPYERFEDLSADASYSSDPTQYSTKGRVSWGGKKETISSNLAVKRPLSLQNAQITFEAATPFRQFREIDLELDHKLDSSVASSLKGKLDDSKAELQIKGENRGSRNNDFYGSVELKTPLAALREAVVSFEHQDDGQTFKSLGSCQHNNRKFTADLQMDHNNNRANTVNNGKLTITWPEDSLMTSWQHNLGNNNIKCSVESTWSRNRQLKVNLEGSNSVENKSNRVQGSLNVQTPWRDSRDVIVKFDTSLGSNMLKSQASLQNNRIEKVVYDILLERMPNAGNVIFMLRTPLYDQKIHGQTKLNWDTYPATASSWFEWAPWARIDFDGSLNAALLDDISLNTKLTTPFKNYENIITGLSHKLENQEYISHAIVSYGVRKNIDFETRLRYDGSVKLFRTKLSSPCPYFRLFNTGFRLNTNPDRLEGSADFELQPYLKKHDGSVSWNYDPNDFIGKLRINTPHKEMPYLQITSWSKKAEGSPRSSHIDVEPSPYGVYSFDSSYSTMLPLELDLTVKTPHAQYDSVGLSASYRPSATDLKSGLKVKYQTGKVIDSQLSLKWQSSYEGNFVVTTPFRGFENNKILARHEISSRGFTCHGEANVGGKNTVCDIVYTSTRSATSGSVSIIIPVPGYEKMSGKFNLKGTVENMQGDASLNIASKIFMTKFSNNMSPTSVKSSIDLQTPYTENMRLSVQHQDSSTSYSELQYEDSFNGQYGSKNIDGKLSLFYAGLDNAKVDASITTPSNSAQLSLESLLASDSFSGKASIVTDIQKIGSMDARLVKTGPIDNMSGTFVINRDGDTLVETSVEASRPGEEFHSKISTRGKWLPAYTVEVDHTGGIYNFNSKTKLSNNDGNIFESEATFKMTDNEMDIIGRLNYKYNRLDNSHMISVHAEGTLGDFKVDVSKKCDGEEITGNIVFQLGNEIKGLIQINNLFKEFDQIGAEFGHSGDTDKFLTTGKVMLSSSKIVSGKLNFYRYNLQRVEVTAELNTPIPEYRYSRFEFRHEGGDNRLSCSMNLQYGDNKKMSMDLITQCASPSHSMSFNMKTPYKGYEEIILTSNFDDSKANARVVVWNGMEFTLTGVHDLTGVPYSIQYQINTPVAALSKITLDLKGALLDGTANLALNVFKRKVEVGGALQYTSPYNLNTMAHFTTDIRGINNILLKLRNEDDADQRKTSHFELTWSPTQKVVVDGRFQAGSTRWSSKQEYVLELDVQTPFEKVRSLTVDVSHNIETNNMKSVVSFEFNQQKLIDLDVNFDKSIKYDYSAVIRKPWPMEYTTSYQSDDSVLEGDFYANWNRNDPSSNVRAKGSWKTHPTDIDRSLTLAVITPSRTVGVDHSLTKSADKYSSSGKVYWAQDDDRKLSYSVDITNSNRRKDQIYNGNFKLGFPTRTFGVTGSMTNNQLVRAADASFSWDLDRDDSKRVELQVSLSGKDYTKADISFRLPAQDLQVNSALILNQGNIIIDGKTDISYSSESRKTFTLFSKVKNTQMAYNYFSGSGNGFNYSVELGVRHPETKVDVKIDSHMAKSDDLLTSSLGIQYMTVHQQMKNLALFAEIDKIRKQICFTASGPSDSAAVSGRIVQEEPLSLMLLGSVNGQEKFKSMLDVSKGTNALKFEIGHPDNLLTFKTYYPNSTTIHSEIMQNDDQEAMLALRLVNSRLLKTRINWRPATANDVKNFLIENIMDINNNLPQVLYSQDASIRKELTSRYEDVSSSVAEDIKPLVRFIQVELESFASDLENIQRKMSDLHNNNRFYLRDIGSGIVINAYYIGRAYTIVQEQLQQFVGMYRNAINDAFQSVLTKVDQMRQFSWLEPYSVVSRWIQSFDQMLDRIVHVIIHRLKMADFRILERFQAVMPNMNNVYNHPKLEFLRGNVEKLKNFDYNYYVDGFNKAAQNINLTPLRDALYSVKDIDISKVIPERVRNMVIRTSDEVYQQALIAYKYWHMDGNLQKYVTATAELLKDVVEDEIREYLDFVTTWSPITIFDPRNGHIETSIPLPFEMKRLDELPNLSLYVQTIADLYNNYVPDMDTVYKYSPMNWYNNNTGSSLNDITLDDVMTDLEDFKPSNKRYVSRQ